MRVQGRFFKPMFTAILGSKFEDEDNRRVTLADIKPYSGYRCLRATPEEQALEDEALELWKKGNRVAYYYLEEKRWVSFSEFQELV